MSIRLSIPRRISAIVVAITGILVADARAQTTPAPAEGQGEHQHAAPSAAGPQAAHDMSAMSRQGSGTSWLPDTSPMYAIHRQRGPWTLMAHENVFVQFLRDSGSRGEQQMGSINWVMGMAERDVGTGHLGLRGMFSLEPWTIRGCGYPDLLASGEQCHGEMIHDRQHPHDLWMELAAVYDAPVRNTIRWQVYGAPSGEPALGPVAYPHRVSAMPNPLAPITHHWLDSTHISFGVVTGGLYGKRWKAEASVFNGREPDERRTNFDFGALDSVSGRLWWLPTANLAFQISGGRLEKAEAAEGEGPRTDVKKITASGTYHRVFRANSVWATTVGWGRNGETGGRATNALLIETNLTVEDRDTWFGRFEAVGKSPHDLAVDIIADTITVGKVQGGYTRYAASWRGFKPGLGAEVSAGFVPRELQAAYGSRVNVGFGVFVTLRPVAMVMATATGTARTMVMVQTALDPAKLSCSPPVDPRNAARTTYEGKTYYFCSVEDRDKFLTDPATSLSMMPPKQ
jgi:YHS domain-containing protein